VHVLRVFAVDDEMQFEPLLPLAAFAVVVCRLCAMLQTAGPGATSRVGADKRDSPASAVAFAATAKWSCTATASVAFATASECIHYLSVQLEHCYWLLPPMGTLPLA